MAIGTPKTEEPVELDKHIVFAETLLGLRRAVGRMEELLDRVCNGDAPKEAEGSTQGAPPDPPEPLSQFLVNGSCMVQAQIEQLDNVRSGLEEALF